MITPFSKILRQRRDHIIQINCLLNDPRSLHNFIKDTFSSCDHKYRIFSYYFLDISARNINSKYLKIIKMDLSVFANEVFKCCYKFMRDYILHSPERQCYPRPKHNLKRLSRETFSSDNSSGVSISNDKK